LIAIYQTKSSLFVSYINVTCRYVGTTEVEIVIPLDVYRAFAGVHAPSFLWCVLPRWVQGSCCLFHWSPSAGLSAFSECAHKTDHRASMHTPNMHAHCNLQCMLISTSSFSSSCALWVKNKSSSIDRLSTNSSNEMEP